jgi:hypothetical protein
MLDKSHLSMSLEYLLHPDAEEYQLKERDNASALDKFLSPSTGLSERESVVPSQYLV